MSIAQNIVSEHPPARRALRHQRGLSDAAVTPPWADLATPLVVEYFPGEHLNYYPDGIPLQAVRLVNNLPNNPWVHVVRGDILCGRAFGALWSAWHECVIAGRCDPSAPLSIPDLVRLTGLSRATVDNAIEFGLFFEFLVLIKEEDKIGTETQINRGRPPARYVFAPLREAWQGFMRKIQPLLWRALLISQFPDLPVQALALEDLLARYEVTADQIAAIDDISQPLFDQNAAEWEEAVQCLSGRVETWRGRIIAALDGPRLRLPEGAIFRNAAEFGDLLNRLDLEAKGGVRTGRDRYRAADLTGRTLSAQRESNKRLGIASIPVIKPYAVLPGIPLLTQCRKADPVAYERGRIKLIASNGATVVVSPGYAKSFDYEVWLNENGGPGGASLHVWHSSMEKWEAAVTEPERALRDDVSRRQKAISSRRTKAEDGQDEPSPLDQWFIDQGQMRAELFDLEPIPNEEATDVWPAIVCQIQGERNSAEIETAQAEDSVEHQAMSSSWDTDLREEGETSSYPF